MKKLFVALVFVVSSYTLKAEMPDQYVPRPDAFYSMAIHISSNINSGSTAVAISTQVGTQLYGISINNPGTSSTVELYDGRVSTSAVGIRKLGTFNTTASKFFPFNVGISSGIMAHNTGNPPADVSIIYSEKNRRF